ncbi:RcnB family protein [Tatumella citrea]|uniref:RcnB family protein n=1 Tax=Tatumella citrea TaxID=53336 RepID=UPI0022B279E1|nr:RcnB family protein [Tatumella citrea]
MRKPLILASSVILMSVSLLSGCSSASKHASEAPVTTEAPAADANQPAPEVATPAPAAAPETKFADPLEKNSVFGDFRHYKIGDIIPALYRTQTYNISKWQLRKIPAPTAGSHWTYFGGDYVLISDEDGKILRIFSGDIIYR